MNNNTAHANRDHEATKAARAACRKARSSSDAARQVAIDALLAAFDGVRYIPRPNHWVFYAASAFAKVHTDYPREAAAAVLDYFATTDYQPTTDPATIVRATLRRAS